MSSEQEQKEKMHSPVIVITERDDLDPVSRVVGREMPPEMGTIQWAAIGGRYTGMVMPTPNALSARVHGDALPSGEAILFSGIQGVVRMMPNPGDGVDQVMRCEMDMANPLGRIPRALIDTDGTFHDPGLTPEQLALEFAEGHNFVALNGHEAELEELHLKLDAWAQRVLAVLEAAPASARISVVDAKY
jgi:hypothetical protein